MNQKLTSTLLQAISSNEFKDELLELRENDITDQEALKLAQALRENRFIKSLDVSDNKIGDQGAVYLSQNNQLKTLKISRNEISAKGASALAQTTIENLDLSGNNIGNEGARAFNSNPHLVELNLSGCEITEEGAAPLFNIRGLKSLLIACNAISDSSLTSLPTNCPLERLDLSQNNISNRGTDAIMRHCKDIQFLSLSSNPIGDEGAEAVSSSTSLQELYLSQCDIGDRGAIALAKSSHKLSKLILLLNDIHSEGAKALSGHPSVTEIDISYNKISENVSSFFRNTGKRVKVNMSHNPFDEEAIRKCQKLEEKEKEEKGKEKNKEGLTATLEETSSNSSAGYKILVIKVPIAVKEQDQKELMEKVKKVLIPAVNDALQKTLSTSPSNISQQSLGVHL